MSFSIILKATDLKLFWIRYCNNENVFKRDFYPFGTFFFVINKSDSKKIFSYVK